MRGRSQAMIDAQSSLDEIRFGFGPNLGGGGAGAIPLGVQIVEAPLRPVELKDIAVFPRAASLYNAEPLADPSDKDARRALKKKHVRSHLEFYLNDAHRKIA